MAAPVPLTDRLRTCGRSATLGSRWLKERLRALTNTTARRSRTRCVASVGVLCGCSIRLIGPRRWTCVEDPVGDAVDGEVGGIDDQAGLLVEPLTCRQVGVDVIEAPTHSRRVDQPGSDRASHNVVALDASTQDLGVDVPALMTVGPSSGCSSLAITVAEAMDMIFATDTTLCAMPFLSDQIYVHDGTNCRSAHTPACGNPVATITAGLSPNDVTVDGNEHRLRTPPCRLRTARLRRRDVRRLDHRRVRPAAGAGPRRVRPHRSGGRRRHGQGVRHQPTRHDSVGDRRQALQRHGHRSM
jgi:hypothetical protein